MLEYYIFNPTGNITALVTTKASVSDYKKINDEIMRINPKVEQVGFVDLNGKIPYLRMCGGEFCGNATMCAATLYCINNNINSAEVSVSVYGLKTDVIVSVNKEINAYNCCLKLEKPEIKEKFSFMIDGELYELPLIEFTGISHIIADSDFDRIKAEHILKKYANELSVSAMGFMIYNKFQETLCPIVYVKDCDTLFYENSCASGSCAVCAYLTRNELSEKEIILKQNGGVLKAVSSKNDSYIHLSGSVAFVEKLSEII